MTEDQLKDPAKKEPIRQFRFALSLGGACLLIISWYLDSLSPYNFIHITLSLSGLILLLLGLHNPSTSRVHAIFKKLANWFGMHALQLLGLFYAFFLSLIARSAAGDTEIAYAGSHGAIWFLGILMATLATLNLTSIRNLRKPSIQKTSALSIILLSAFILRAFMITEIPYGVTGDEGGTGFTALDYLNGTRSNILASAWFEFPAFYFWLASRSLNLISGRLLAIRIVSAVGGTLAVAALYFALRNLFSREHALLGATLLAVNHVHIVFSRGAINNIWDGVFVMLAIGAVWHAWETNDRNAFILAGTALGFSQFFYTTGHLTPVCILLWIPLLRRENPIRQRLPGVILMFAIAAIIFLPLGMHYISQPDNVLIPMRRVSILNEDWITTTSQLTGKSTFQLFSDQFRRTIMSLTQTTVRGIYNPGRPILLSIDAVLFLAGFGLAVIQIWDPKFSILLLGLVGPILAGTFSVEAPSSQRLLYALPFLMALISIALVELRRYISRRLPDQTLLLPALMFLILSGSAYSNLAFFSSEAMPDHRYSDRGAYFSRALSDFLNRQPEGIEARMIFPAPMQYQSIASLAYLAPEVKWQNIDWYRLELGALQRGETRVLFVFQKQNLGWSELLMRRFPDAIIYAQDDHYGVPLFRIVEVDINKNSIIK